MTKIPMIKAALLGSSSALGLNWIYDKPLLDNYALDNETIFVPIDHDLYKKSKSSYNVYPNHKVGDLDFMGEVLYQFNEYLTNTTNPTPKEWREVFYNYFSEAGPYDAYIEHYGKDILAKMEQEKKGLKEPQINTDHIDKQLIGLAFILAFYEHENSVNKLDDALLFSRTLTGYSGIDAFSKSLYNILYDLDQGVTKQDALMDNIIHAPDEYQEALKKAFEIKDVDTFISNYSGVACGLNHAFPLIYFIVLNSDSWEEGLRLNATLGGASSARGIFISTILNKLYGVPDQYKDKLNYYKK